METLKKMQMKVDVRQMENKNICETREYYIRILVIGKAT